MQFDFKDLIIDEEDRKLFLVDDKVLKAEALQNSILPRIKNLLYLIIEEINKVYQLDALEESRVSKSPNFRKSNRNKPITWNYEVCSVGLTGKIKTDYWLSLTKKDKIFSKYTPLHLVLQLSSEYIGCYFVIHPKLKLLDQCYQQYDDWVKNNFLSIFPLLQEANARYEVFYSDECKPFTSLDKYFTWKKRERILTSGFFIEKLRYPLNEEQFEKIKRFFLYLFPIYQTFIDISKGCEINFSNYLSMIQEHHLNLLKNEERDINAIGNSIKQEIDLRKLAEQKIKVLPGTRWQVFQRDNWKCVACGRSADDGIILHVDHILPRSKGGLDILSNYQTLCNVCNIGKSNKDETNIKARTR